MIQSLFSAVAAIAMVDGEKIGDRFCSHNTNSISEVCKGSSKFPSTEMKLWLILLNCHSEKQLSLVKTTQFFELKDRNNFFHLSFG
ncbi:MAG TPA: hypothetical protein IGS53_25805 [Leptolyngbyaceae cyanobacterium M33_DOE_097]|uniref:Uncharacterized protein n=1 Tax=Oscillatoriales cyanobacterium SpSt-418 TaxID=2282169 RepID=A0A7C3PCT1_9CYAN|nr:hypothetical protein [Leptolyngbyaceae cyanobacterium M33_DOE_097]